MGNDINETVIKTIKQNPRISAFIEKFGLQQAWKHETIDCLLRGGYDYSFLLPYSYYAINSGDSEVTAKIKISCIEKNLQFLLMVGADYNHLVSFMADPLAVEHRERFMAVIEKLYGYLLKQFHGSEIFIDDFFDGQIATKNWKKEYAMDYKNYMKILSPGKSNSQKRIEKIDL